MAVRMMRLDKYLAEMGCGTRQEVKKQIRKGLVTVDGQVTKSPETKVSDHQVICLDGREITYTSFEYYMLNKPSGVVSATEDAKDTTVVSLIADRKRKDLFPVGRLDKDTEGLLLITNDGNLAHRLLSPRKHVDKTYFARISGQVTETEVEAFQKGVNIGTFKEPLITRPGQLEILKSAPVSEILLTIQEGKFHQVKRMFQAVGMEVTYLKRLSMGSLTLDETLLPGAYRELSKEEVERLYES